VTRQFPVIINVRDRLEPVRDLITWLEQQGQENIWLCDNDSTYPPMVEFLRSTRHHVRLNGLNLVELRGLSRRQLHEGDNRDLLAGCVEGRHQMCSRIWASGRSGSPVGTK
jgi:hypothetical protein